jgi:hypothetical protein
MTQRFFCGMFCDSSGIGLLDRSMPRRIPDKNNIDATDRNPPLRIREG